MKRYHLHRSDKQWNDHDEIEQLLASLRIMTVACCLENEPYLFTVDFVWEPQTRQLWFHCAPEGRKMDILQANPRVCVTVVEDRGYVEGECDHAYRSLILEGEAQMVTDLAEKRRGLELLARKHEPQPETVLAPSRATKNPCERSESYASQSTPSAEKKDRKRNNENEVTFRLGGF